MIGALSIFIVRLIAFFYGKTASHFFPRPPFDDRDIEAYFFQKGGNFRALMARVDYLRTVVFGIGGVGTLLRLNLIQYLLFAVAFIVFLSLIPGFHEVFSFVRRGFVIELDPNERIFALQNYRDLTPDGLYVGDAVSRIGIMTLIFMATISASGSVALLYNFRMIKTFAGRNMGFVATNARLAFAFFISIACDVAAVAILLIAIALAGKVGGPRLVEYFKADFAQHYFGYGIDLEIGVPTQGTSDWGYGFTQTDVFFGQYSELKEKVAKPRWPSVIFADEPIWMFDASKICDQLGIERDDCADRMRAMFFRHLDISAEWIPHLARSLLAQVGLLACGRNLWSGIFAGVGANQSLRLTLPFFSSIAALILARALIVPWLIILSFTDRVLVTLGKRVTLQSIDGYREMSVQGAALLSMPPVLAATVIFSLFIRIFC